MAISLLFGFLIFYYAAISTATAGKCFFHSFFLPYLIFHSVPVPLVQPWAYGVHPYGDNLLKNQYCTYSKTFILNSCRDISVDLKMPGLVDSFAQYSA